MILAVVGSRTFNDYEMLKSEIEKLSQEDEIQKIVTGCASGADAISIRYAKDNGIPFLKNCC